MPDEQYATGGFVPAPKPGAPLPLPPRECVFPAPTDAPAVDVKLIFSPERLKGWTFTTHNDGTWTMSRSYGRQSGGDG